LLSPGFGGIRGVEQSLETDDVDGFGGHVEDIAAAAAFEPYRRIGLEQAAELRHVRLHRAGRPVRRRAAPQRIDDPVERHRPATLDEQEREEAASLAAV
jgi:hypothetical protein